MSKIILKGYYGRGNLGDDVLMLITFQLAKFFFPESEIVICSDSEHSVYIKNIIENVKIEKSNEQLDVDCVIHGGGGVYFDFKKGNLKFKVLNQVIRILSYSVYRKIYFSIQGWRNNQGIVSKTRIGLGIGIGTYTSSSKKFYADILSLSDFDYLIVRDRDSANHLKKFKFHYPVRVATDMAFLHEYWNPQNVQGQSKSGKNIGLVLRDWPIDDHSHLKVLHEVAIRLETLGYQLTIFSLDQFEDVYFQNLFSRFKLITWDPFKVKLSDFLKEFTKIDLVVSSRAHGCIIPACLGIPAVCLGIEAKLEKISEMLKTSSTYIPQPFEKESILNAIIATLTNLGQKRLAVAMDVNQNHELMNKEIVQLGQFIRQREI